MVQWEMNYADEVTLGRSIFASRAFEKSFKKQLVVFKKIRNVSI
jgi:hypothetical protein